MGQIQELLMDFKDETLENIAGRNGRLYRERLGLSLEALAKQAGWDKTNLKRFEDTGHKYSHKSLKRLADAIGIDIMALHDKKTAFNLGRLVLLNIYTADMIRRDADGILTIDHPAHELGGESSVFPTDGNFAEDAFVFVINDDGMSPRLKVGDKVVVEPGLIAKPKNLVIAAIYRKKTQKSEVVVRKYADRPEGFELIPEDDDFRTESPLIDGISIVGTVVLEIARSRD